MRRFRKMHKHVANRHRKRRRVERWFREVFPGTAVRMFSIPVLENITDVGPMNESVGIIYYLRTDTPKREQR